MKKLLVISVLLGLMALPMFASDITFGGDLAFGFIGDFGDNEAEDAAVTLDIKATVDDFNSLVIEFDYVDDEVDKALVTTDVGMWLGLPVGVVVNWGYDDPDANEFHAISKMENEQVFNFSPDEYLGIALLLSASFVEVELAFNPTATVAEDGVTAGYILAGLAVKEAIPGLNAEVYYFQGGVAAFDTYDEGWIAFDAAYATEIGDISLEAGAGFVYAMLDANDWAYGVAAALGISMFDLTVGLDGNETDALDELSATAVVAPIDMVDIYAGVDLGFASGADTLQAADIGVNAHVGAAEVYVGYLITENGVDKWNAPDALTDGGAYIKFDIDY